MRHLRGRRNAHLQEPRRLQRPSLGQAAARDARHVHRQSYPFQGLHRRHAAGGQARAGDRRRQLGLRHRQRGGPRRCMRALEPAHRLLVPAEDRVRPAAEDLPIWNLPVPLQRLLLRGIVRLMIGDYRRYGLQKPVTDCSTGIRPTAPRHSATSSRAASSRFRASSAMMATRYISPMAPPAIRSDRRRHGVPQLVPIPAAGHGRGQERRGPGLRRCIPGRRAATSTSSAPASRARALAPCWRRRRSSMPIDRHAGRVGAADRRYPRVVGRKAAGQTISSIRAARGARCGSPGACCGY